MQQACIAKTFAPRRLAVLAVALGLMATAAAATPQAPSPRDGRQYLAQQLQTSDSPRDRALGSQLLAGDPASAAHLHERARILQKAARAAPTDRIVQTLWANLPVPVARGRQRQAYAGHWLAQARLEPDNGVAWLAVVDYAWKSGSTRATDAALAHMASAESYNEHLGQAVAAWRDVLRQHMPKSAQVSGGSAEEQGMADFVIDEANKSVTPPIDSIIDACRQSTHSHVTASRLRACGKIGRLMMRRSQTMLGRLVGVAVLRASHEGKPADVAMIRAVGWQNEQYANAVAAMAKNPYAKQSHLDMLQKTDSEMQAIQYELRIAGIALLPPDGWKQTLNGKSIEPLDDPSAGSN